jgi:hypothetical protein
MYSSTPYTRRQRTVIGQLQTHGALLAEKGTAAPDGEEAVWRREPSWIEETNLCVSW